jgi:hypothetical protein
MQYDRNRLTETTRTLKFLRFSAAVTVRPNVILRLSGLLKGMSEPSYPDINPNI